MVGVCNTRDEPLHDRMAFWLKTVCEQILPVRIDPRLDAKPRAVMACGQFGALLFRDVAGGDHVYMRSEGYLRSGDPDTVQIGYSGASPAADKY